MFDPVIDNPFERFKAFFIGLFLLFVGILFVKFFKNTGERTTYGDYADQKISESRWEIKKSHDEQELTVLTESAIHASAKKLALSSSKSEKASGTCPVKH